MEPSAKKVKTEEDSQSKAEAVVQDVANPAPSKLAPVTPEELRVYYERLFPVSLFFRWLQYGDNSYIKNREFSFTLKDDVYVRYCAFNTKEEFKAGLLKKVPVKIDVGAVFNAPPSLKDSVDRFQPLEKELVFDIDMTDYDDVRSCCDEANICRKCWPLMTCALKVIDTALREDFGFNHLMWVYSGRRGIHCWVCDPRARKLSNEGREAVVEYLSLHLGEKKALELAAPLHPSLKRAYDTLVHEKSCFVETCLDNQQILSGEGSLEKIMDLGKLTSLGFTGFQEMDADSRYNWEVLQKWQLKASKNKKLQAQISVALPKIVFTYCYPRLDVNVSKQLNHLLKAPFCVHPKTGRVCVPFDPSKADTFDPFTVPTIQELINELNKGLPREQTSLAQYIKLFKDFVHPLERMGIQRKMKMQQGGMTPMEF
eukprot:g63714.t1